MINFDYRKHQRKPEFSRNNLDCYLCSARKKFILSTPEEDVRQSVINYLIDELKVPSSCIDAEVPMSHYTEGKSGRADLIVRDNHDVPLILIECKAPSQFISDAVIEQLYRYDAVVNARILVATNGLDSFVAERDDDGSLRELSSLPSYFDLISKKSLSYLTYQEVPYKRVDFRKQIPEDLLAECFEEGFISEKTNPALYPIIFNLMGWMFDAKDKVTASSLKNTTFVADGGIRLAQFGNAGGGAYGTEYRYFVIRDNKGNNQLISLTITGVMHTVNDPRWGNTNGATILAVAIDDFKTSHMSLQLRLDKYVQLTKNTATIWHDGTLTVGKLGQAKRQSVIDYIISKAPHLTNNEGVIILGKFELSKEIHSNQRQTKDFLDNLLLYALLRDEYRLIHKAAAK